MFTDTLSTLNSVTYAGASSPTPTLTDGLTFVDGNIFQLMLTNDITYSFYLSFWIKTVSMANAYNYIFSSLNTEGQEIISFLIYGNSNWYYSSMGSKYIASARIPNTNNWQHVLMSWALNEPQ